ncbi:phosphotransferase [Nesterenkonia sp. CF4.4]|uniref:phosphotransferase n=1 Tax=Nesterenkonia sp. CF4.4 TaxID=3373079 RepID=UPI003EE7ED99
MTSAELEARQLAFMESYDAHPPIAEAIQHTGVYATSVHLESLQHRPGAGVTGVYRVATGRPVMPRGGPAGAYTETSDHVDELYVGMTTEPVPADADGVVQSHSPYGRLSIWQHPLDPSLPGLRIATDPDSVRNVWGAGRDLVSLETISYRPLRRAVIAAEFADGTRLFLKVLRARRADQLHTRHQLLLDAGIPAAVPVREPVLDVVALREGTGESLAEYFLADGAAGAEPEQFIELLEKLPAEVMTLPAREAWTDRLSAYATAATSALPEAADRIRALVEHISAALPRTDRGPVVPTHGDFYEANLLMRGGEVSALLDVDSLGPGHRVDDLACFLGHLAVLPAVDARYVHVPAAFQRFAAGFSATVDAQALRVRTASVALSLVAGARDTRRQHWQAQAEHRLSCAEAVVGLHPPDPALPQWPRR